MATPIVSEFPNVSKLLYESLVEQLSELGRQLQQPNSYPYSPFLLQVHLQNAIDGKFGSGDVHVVKLNGQTTTDQIAQSWREAGLSVSNAITQAQFPLVARETMDDSVIEIISPGRPFTETEGLNFLEAAGLERPTYEHALRFAEQCGKVTRSKYHRYIIFLHKPWIRPDLPNTHFFVGISPNPDLGLFPLDGPGNQFLESCELAGVRRRK
jgi:hypothetical protein